MPTETPTPLPAVPAVAPLILVVDDSAAQRRLISAMLARTGLEVAAAPSAEAALALCAGPEGARVRVVVSDWQMPGMNGPEFCAAFRALRPASFAYFILMTSRTDSRAKIAGLKAGADDFVTRPVDVHELRARIETGLRILHMHEALEHRSHEVQVANDALRRLQAGIERDLGEARKLQRAFLPPPDATFGGCTLSRRLLPCNQIGGDLVGWFPLCERKVALYAIDVSGHGIASALMTGRLAGLFSPARGGSNVARPDPDGPPDPPDAVLARLNTLALKHFSSDIYFTAVIVYVDLIDGRVELCQAGHPHPIVRGADGGVRRLGEGGPPVGLLDQAQFDLVVDKLAPGDVLLIHSDGVTECADTWGDMLGEERLVALVGAAEGHPAEMIDGIEAGLRAHAGMHGFDDDVSMVALRFTPLLGRAAA